MFRIYLLIVLLGSSVANAAVPTYNVWNDSLTVNIPLGSAVANGIDRYENYLQAIINSKDLYKQIESLNSLEQFANSLCQLCNYRDKMKFNNYINTTNSILASQFNIANDSLKQIRNMGKGKIIADIILQLTSDPQLATLALQRSATEIQLSTQNTLAQMQLLLVQQQQRDMVITKQTENNLANMYDGLTHSGL